MHKNLLDKVQRLSLFLMLSGATNILLAATLCYFYFKERPPTPICESMPAYHERPGISIETTNASLIRTFATLSMEQLIDKLYDDRLANDGFTRRDLALGCLVSIHNFDIHKALRDETPPRQKRVIAFDDGFGKKREIVTFSDLHNGHYNKIISFAKTEQWPLTSKGLFLLVKAQGQHIDKNLKYAFCLTPEFLIVDLLMKRANADITKQQILSLLKEGSWEALSDFAERQRIGQNLSREERRSFLLSYVEQGSPTAAALLIKTDTHYATKQLDDDQVLQLLKQATLRTPEVARYVLEMLISPRQDKVWKEAANRLYEFAGEEKPPSFNKNTVLARFLPVAVKQNEQPIHRVDKIVAQNLEETKPAKSPTYKRPPPQQPKPQQKITSRNQQAKPQSKWRRAYTIKEGDSLWKIGRLFNVNIEELKKYNNLTSDSLTPGTMIIVP